jgi:hypothetical protein
VATSLRISYYFGMFIYVVMKTNTGIVRVCISAQARRDMEVCWIWYQCIGIDCRGALVHTRRYVCCTAT